MNGRFLLDTNIVIALFAGDADVAASLAAAEEVFIPAVDGYWRAVLRREEIRRQCDFALRC